MGLFSWMTKLGPTPAEIRAEVWKLGVRHRGEPLKGALEELKAAGAGAPVARTALLHACVQQLRRA